MTQRYKDCTDVEKLQMTTAVVMNPAYQHFYQEELEYTLHEAINSNNPAERELNRIKHIAIRNFHDNFVKTK